MTRLTNGNIEFSQEEIEQLSRGTTLAGIIMGMIDAIKCMCEHGSLCPGILVNKIRQKKRTCWNDKR